MCGRYGLWAPPEELERRYSGTLTFDYEPRYNIAPGGTGSAVVTDETDAEIDRLQWGLLPNWVDDADDWGYPINARAETIDEKPSFSGAFEQRRCLVPANTFYEWTGPPGRRTPFSVGVEDLDVFSMAGIWERWSENGTERRTFAIVTTEPNAVVGEIHDRMPVILDREEEGRWLRADDTDGLSAMLDPFPAERTTSHEVSTAVNDPSNEGSGLVEPVGSNQTGLEEFG